MALSTDTAETLPVKVLFMGHSYMTHFGEFLRSRPAQTSLTFDMEIDQVDPIVKAIGRADINVVTNNLYQWVTDSDPDICVLHLGDNVIRHNDVDIEGIAVSVFNLALKLCMRYSIQCVLISQLLFRNVTRCTDFNMLVVQLNKCLDACVKQSGVSGIFFWHHHGFWQPGVKDALTHRDGVHLNFEGNLKLYKSFKRGLSRAINYLRQ